MIHILVTTHGKMAEGILQSAAMLVGEQEKVEYVSFTEGMDMEELDAIYREKLEHVSKENPFLIFCDILGGTPFNMCSRHSFKNENIAVIYGVNLPILVEAMTSREGMEFSAYVTQIEDACKESIGLSEL